MSTIRRKRILFVCGVFYPEPVVSARLQADLARKLSENFSVTVLRPRPTRPQGFSFPEYDYSTLPFKVVEMDSYTCPASSLLGRFRESISHGRWCARYIRHHHHKIDFIYNDSWHLFGVYLVAKAANQYHIPYITPVQDVYPESLASKLPDVRLLKSLVMHLLTPLDDYSLSHAACVQTNSEKMAGYLSESRGIDRKRFVVVRNWQDEQEFIDYARENTRKPEDTPFTFMYMGNVGPLAGIEVLFDAFAGTNLKNARLVIAGSGPAKADLQQKAKHYACSIDFWEVPSGMVPEIQAQADVMLLPVRKGFAKSSVPSKLIAYMFSAKPIIACVDIDSDTAECIKVSDAGWIAEPENDKSLRECMEQVYLLSEDTLHRKGKMGYDYAMEVFSKNKNIEILNRICIEILNK